MWWCQGREGAGRVKTSKGSFGENDAAVTEIGSRRERGAGQKG